MSGGLTGDLRMWSALIIHELRKCGFYNNDPESEGNRQLFALGEECGEAIGAFRRYTGQARRNGSKEEFEDELADVVITAFCTAYCLSVDMDIAIDRKLGKIFQRGWKEIDE